MEFQIYDTNTHISVKHTGVVWRACSQFPKVSQYVGNDLNGRFLIQISVRMHNVIHILEIQTCLFFVFCRITNSFYVSHVFRLHAHDTVRLENVFRNWINLGLRTFYLSWLWLWYYLSEQMVKLTISKINFTLMMLTVTIQIDLLPCNDYLNVWKLTNVAILLPIQCICI